MVSKIYHYLQQCIFPYVAVQHVNTTFCVYTREITPEVLVNISTRLAASKLVLGHGCRLIDEQRADSVTNQTQNDKCKKLLQGCRKCYRVLYFV